MNEIKLDTSCFRVIESMIAGISDGLRGYGHELVVDLAPLRGLLAEACITKDLRHIFRVPPRGVPDTLDDELVLQYYRFVKADYPRRYGRSTPALPLPLHDAKKEESLYRQVFGDVPPPQPLKHDGKSLVKHALETAKWNLVLCESRLAALYFLCDALPQVQHIQAIRQNVDAARDELMLRRARNYGHYLKFVVMSGDPKLLDEARSMVYEESFSDRMGVMQYLEVDHVFQHRTSVATEEQFRNELRNLATAGKPSA